MTYEYLSLVDVNCETLCQYGAGGWRVIAAHPARTYGKELFWTALLVREVPRG